ncbi:hypothetical protein [Streptomyces sp. NPDC048606]|uniref:hypothetical protein n=1 Tax=Streptomyces sp. NPDC048606 TaxID=3154726 RepID=UPI00341EFE25
MYEHGNFDGRRLTWSDCDFEHLGNWGFTDKTSSWHNNQTRGTVTRVYNWVGYRQQLWASTAPRRAPTSVTRTTTRPTPSRSADR